MLEIFGYWLCVYLVVKGFEIYNSALVSDPEEKTTGQRNGKLALMACMVLAAAFLIWISRQGDALRNIGR